MGNAYEYIDTGVTPGEIYYYRLESVDFRNSSKYHGPICVDWDGDGLPDDWELTYGFNPNHNNADQDVDNDGLTNLQEYRRGTDPIDPDTDGDGILDGDEEKEDNDDRNGSRSLGRGIHILASDETGMVLELHTEEFERETLWADGEEFERLKISDYVHGTTRETGKSEMPLKGLLIDLPEGKSADVKVVDVELKTHQGYRIYPYPDHKTDDQSDLGVVEDIFVWNETA